MWTKGNKPDRDGRYIVIIRYGDGEYYDDVAGDAIYKDGKWYYEIDEDMIIPEGENYGKHVAAWMPWPQQFLDEIKV